MTKKEASYQLNIGYMIFVIGVIIGLYIKNINISTFMIGYIIWSTYMGYKLLYKRLKSISIDSPVHISAKNSFEYFQKVFQFKWVSELIIFFICYIIGNLGGSIYLQFKLSKIAYFKK